VVLFLCHVLTAYGDKDILLIRYLYAPRPYRQTGFERRSMFEVRTLKLSSAVQNTTDDIDVCTISHSTNYFPLRSIVLQLSREHGEQEC
jgi:hypothetical protein